MELRRGGAGEANGRETRTSLMADGGSGDKGLANGDCARVAEFGALDMNARSRDSEFG